MADTRSVLVRITGRVQGVGYRAWTARDAARLGLSGWVRNLRGGEVEAVFSGPRSTVEAMLVACSRGPEPAKVSKVEIVGPTELVHGPFVIRPDAQ